MKRRDDRAIIVELSANTIYGDDSAVIGYEGIFAGTAGMILASIPFAWMLKVSRPLVPQIEPVL